MSRSSKPRKAYRPRSLINPLTLLRPASPADRQAIEARFYSALESMVAGRQPGLDEWRDLSDAVNTVETLAGSTGHLNPSEVMPVVQDAITGMVLASRRYKAGQGMRLDAAGIAALREVVGIYVQCMERLTEAEMRGAQQATARRTEQVLRGQRVDGVEVVTC